MFENIEWLFFDVGSTLIDEHLVYEHIFREIAKCVNSDYEAIYNEAVKFYKENQKGNLELEKKYNIPHIKWHIEDECLYESTPYCLEVLCKKYNIGIIANQSLGTKDRLAKWGLMKYIDLVIASAEEGVSKPNPLIFEIALRRAECDADKAIMIGDRIDNDIVPAKKIGMKTIWIKQGFGGYWKITEDEEQPDYIVESIADLCNCL